MGGIVQLISGLFGGFETPKMPELPPMPAVPTEMTAAQKELQAKREAKSLALQQRQVETAEAEQRTLTAQLAEQKKQGEITAREVAAGDLKRKKEEEALALESKRRALVSMRGNQNLLTGGLGAVGKPTLLTKTLGA